MLETKISNQITALKDSSNKNLSAIHILFNTFTQSNTKTNEELKANSDDLKSKMGITCAEITNFNNNMQDMMKQLNEDCMNINLAQDLKFNVLGETIHKMNSESKTRYENLLNTLGNMIIDVGTNNNSKDRNVNKKGGSGVKDKDYEIEDKEKSKAVDILDRKSKD